MAINYTEQQIEKVLASLPEELGEALFSMETAQHIWDIREKHDVMDKKSQQIPTYVGYVLMGLMLPSQFEEALQKELKLPKKIAEQINREINRLIFYPVKPALERLYQIPKTEGERTATPKTPQEESIGARNESQEPAPRPASEDPYRESAEEDEE